MDFDEMIQTINDLMSKERPETFSSSWIAKQAPHCYCYILKNMRTDFGAVDWDRVTRALEWKFRRRWIPGRRVRSCVPYRNHAESEDCFRKTSRQALRLHFPAGPR